MPSAVQSSNCRFQGLGQGHLKGLYSPYSARFPGPSRSWANLPPEVARLMGSSQCSANWTPREEVWSGRREAIRLLFRTEGKTKLLVLLLPLISGGRDLGKCKPKPCITTLP